MNGAYAEGQVLNQVGVVAAGQVFPFWVRNQAVVRLRVTSTAPGPVVRLVRGSELVIAPIARSGPPLAAGALPASAGGGRGEGRAVATARLLEMIDIPRSEEGGGGMLSWPTAGAFMSPATIEAAGLSPGDVVELPGSVPAPGGGRGARNHHQATPPRLLKPRA